MVVFPGRYEDLTVDDDSSEILRTIIALFDDTIDTELVLMSLRKSDADSDQISVILRERMATAIAAQRGESLLSRVVASSALDVVGSWLQGLASLILPDRASYLVAGPIGVFLATIRESKTTPDGEGRVRRDVSNRQLARALMAFGFSLDEAIYLEQRVVAGSPLIAITSNDVDMLRRALEIFARSAAVYMGLARTEQAINTVASRLLVTGPRGGGSVVIADAISPLKRLVEEGLGTGSELTQVGREVISIEGETIGEIVDILYEMKLNDLDKDGIADPSEERRIISRYYIIAFGGMLRMGRHRTAVPSEVIDTDRVPVMIRTTREFVQAAPRFDLVNPLSRQDEVAIRRYYDIANYWLEDAHGD
jgi:Fe2+ transport system protein FeoA